MIVVAFVIYLLVKLIKGKGHRYIKRFENLDRVLISHIIYKWIYLKSSGIRLLYNRPTIICLSCRFLCTIWWLTVGENIIATTKIRNNYAAIQLFLVKLSLLILFALAAFLVSVLCFFFDGSLSKVIALPTIAIAIVVALSRS